MHSGVNENCWPTARTVTDPLGSKTLPRLLSMNSPERLKVVGSTVSTRACGITS